MHFNEWKVSWVFFSNSNLKIVLKGPIGNKSVLVQIMAWCRTGDKPLSESILNHFTYAYMRHNMTQITVMANILHGLWTNKKTPHTAELWCLNIGSYFIFERKMRCITWWPFRWLLSRYLLTLVKSLSTDFMIGYPTGTRFSVPLLICGYQFTGPSKGRQGRHCLVCYTLQWYHNGHDGVSNHKPYDCLLNRWFRRRSKKS